MRLSPIIVLIGCTSGSALDDADTVGTRPTDATPTADTADTADTSTGIGPRETWACAARVATDFEDDGEVDYVVYEAYDPERPELRLRYEEDAADDGRIGRWINNVYDQRGNMVLDEWGLGSGNPAQERTTFEWSDEDQELSRRIDTNADGADDLVYTWTYDGDGLALRHEQDLDGDGDADYVFDFVNEGGLRRETRQDNGGDGTVDIVYQYAYDDEDRPTTIEGRSAADVLAFYAVYTVLDANDSVRLELSQDGDMVADEVEETYYDDQGRLIRDREDATADGHFERDFQVLAFDDADRSTVYELVLGEIGALEYRRTTITFERPAGPWLREEVGEVREVEDGPVISSYRRTRSWTCPTLP